MPAARVRPSRVRCSQLIGSAAPSGDKTALIRSPTPGVSTDKVTSVTSELSPMITAIAVGQRLTKSRPDIGSAKEGHKRPGITEPTVPIPVAYTAGSVDMKPIDSSGSTLGSSG